MNSESLKELTAALVKAQAAIKPPAKDKTAKAGPYSYTYADLVTVIESVRQPLAANGLAVVQPIQWIDGMMVVRTVLLHTSGEWLDSIYPLGRHVKPQEQGSEITYARRYSLCALLCIASDEDQDGAPAQASGTRQAPEASKQEASKLPGEARDRIRTAAHAAGITTLAGIATVIRDCGHKSLDTLTPAGVDAVVETLAAMATKEAK